MNPTIVIATHKRVELTTGLINNIFQNQPLTNVVLVVSDHKEIVHFQKIENKLLHIVKAENKPLGLKWQKGVDYARQIKSNPVIILGSDDELGKDFVVNACNKIREGYHFIGLRRFKVKSNKKLYTIDYKPAMPIGGGRIYSAKLLDDINWKLFAPNKNRKLDDDGWNYTLKSNRKILLVSDIEGNGLVVTANKGSWPMMNPFNPYHPNISVVCVE